MHFVRKPIATLFIHLRVQEVEKYITKQILFNYRNQVKNKTHLFILKYFIVYGIIIIIFK